MYFKKAVSDDLPNINGMFNQVIADMDQKGINIWDSVYPACAFPEDIQKGRLYLLMEEDEIISAFALCETSNGEKAIDWENNNAKPLYLYRFATNVKYLRQGIGEITLQEAIRVSKELGAEYLRLLVVDENVPAIEFYKKHNFKKANGIFDISMGESLVLKEYGYELKL